MGNDQVNNVDPDGGSIEGGIGAMIGTAVGFAAPKRWFRKYSDDEFNAAGTTYDTTGYAGF